MAVVRILQFPDPRLKQVGVRVENVQSIEVQTMIADMFETLYAQEHCAGLASTQLDFPEPKQITVIDFSERKDSPLCLINPEILSGDGETFQPEGCMSVKGAYEPVKRAECIEVRYQTPDGDTVTAKHDGFMAKCIQHEIDHLNGVLFIDYLSAMKRTRIREQIRKHKHK